jgi:hypothetical protein
MSQERVMAKALERQAADNVRFLRDLEAEEADLRRRLDQCLADQRDVREEIRVLEEIRSREVPRV